MIVCTFVGLLCMVASAQGAFPNQPNFVVLFADDFGFGDLASYGNPMQEFGHLDTLAAEGIRFTQWYSGEALCTPSRAALMTGRLPVRTGMSPAGTVGARVLDPTSTGGLPYSEVTMAEALKPLGYTTGFVGKYHLGINANSSTDGAHLPSHHGFDYVGHMLPFSNHWTCDETKRHEPKPNPDQCFIYKGSTIVQQPIDHSNLTNVFAADAMQFIESNRDRPFLLYMAFAHMHVSMFSAEKFVNSSNNGIFGDGIREMDDAVGQIMGKLHELGLDTRTVVFFASDHGPHLELCLEGGSPGPFRGGKSYSSWEGGLRVPGIVWAKGSIEPRVSTALASTMDIFPTMVDLAGGTLPPNVTMDGRSLRAVLENPTVASPHDYILNYCASRLVAIRSGPFKAKWFEQALPHADYPQVHCTDGSPHGEFFQTWNCYGAGVTAFDPPQLFDIDSDPGELFPLEVSAPLCDATPAYILPGHGMPDAGYTHREMASLEQCLTLCCSHSDECGSVTYVENQAHPSANCSAGQPCCWLNQLEPLPLAVRENITVAFPTKRYAGPYASVLDHMTNVRIEHVIALQPAPTQMADKSPANQPCCDPSSGCRCNYPNPNP